MADTVVNKVSCSTGRLLLLSKYAGNLSMLNLDDGALEASNLLHHIAVAHSTAVAQSFW